MRTPLIGTLLSLACGSSVLGAETIGFTYDQGNSTIASFGGTGLAQTFRVAGDGLIESLDFWIWNPTGIGRVPTPAFNISLYRWNGTTTVGSSTPVANVPSLPQVPNGLQNGSNTRTSVSGLLIPVTAGDYLLYWNIPGSGSTAPYIRNAAGNVYPNGRALTRDGSSWITLGSVNNDIAFIVEIRDVPSPGALAFLSAGVLAASRRRRSGYARG